LRAKNKMSNGVMIQDRSAYIETFTKHGMKAEGTKRNMTIEPGSDLDRLFGGLNHFEATPEGQEYLQTLKDAYA
jgi:hypothetical protein